MQTHFRSYFLTCIAAIFLLASCTKTNKQGKYIPKDAPVVMHINMGSLSSKLPWDEIKQSQFFKDSYSDTAIPSFVKKILDNPENSGIDIKGELIIFGMKDSSGAYSCIQGDIKDAAKFSAFTNEAISGGTKSEDGELKYVTKSPIAAGWNKEKFFYIFDMPDFKTYDYARESKAAPRDINALSKSIFALKESNSLAKDEKFTELMKKEGDVHFWMNGESLYSDMPSMGGMMMPNLTKMYAGTRTTATINFEKGKILVDAKYYAGKELSKIYKKYEGNGINEDMIKRIPAKDIPVLFAINYKPEAIKEIIELTGFGEMLNIGMAYVGFSVDDFIKANKGDAVFAITDIKETVHTYPSFDSTTAPTTYTTSEPDILFATSIADKDAFKLIINGVKKLSQKSGMGDMSVSVHYNSNDKYFVIGNNKENVDKYLTNPENKFDFIKKISGSPIGGYADLQYLMRKFESKTAKDSTAKAIYDLSIKMWENAYLMGGKYQDGGLTQTFEINLVDKNTNSLKQLNTYIGAIGILQKEQEKKRNKEWEQMRSKIDEDDRMYDEKDTTEMVVEAPISELPTDTSKKNK